jgi:hypothetical protein
MYKELEIDPRELETAGWAFDGKDWRYNSSRGNHLGLQAAVSDSGGNTDIESITLLINHQYFGRLFDRRTGTLNWNLLDSPKLVEAVATEFRFALKPFH